ncbi:MBL fold metallo-hydrolase [Kitasatospora gansuensis]
MPSELVYSVHTAGEPGMYKTSVLVTGEREALLIDGQFTLAEQHRVLADVIDSGKRLTTVFVSAADPDYYFGLQVIRQAFPDVRVVCTPATLAKIEATWKAKLETWALLGANLATEVVIPELLGSDRFELEGHVFEVRGGHRDLVWRTEYVWQGQERAVLGGALLWAGLHAWTADSPTAGERAAWDEVLAQVEALGPRLVVAAMRRRVLPPMPRSSPPPAPTWRRSRRSWPAPPTRRRCRRRCGGAIGAWDWGSRWSSAARSPPAR